MAEAVANSKLFGVSTPDQAIALFLVAQSEGRHPASAAKEYHVIKGRPALRADAMLARFQQAGGSVRWVSRTDERVVAVFSHPQGGDLEVAWSLDDARRAGLAGGDSWRKYPRQMLSARVVSEGVRAVFPAVTSGMYTPEEVSDFAPAPAPSAPATTAPAGFAKPVFSRPALPPSTASAAPAPTAAPAAIEAPAPAESSSKDELVERIFGLCDSTRLSHDQLWDFLRSTGVVKSEEWLQDFPEKVLSRIVAVWSEKVVPFSKGGAQ